MESIRAYPLYWPEGWARSKYHKVAKFGDYSIAYGRRKIQDEVRLFGGTNLIVSSNLELNQDGNPRSKQRQPEDRGVAIFFKRNGIDSALACDVYTTVEDNLWALCRTVEALRQIERDGSPSLINRAFKGFKALADPDSKKWFEILNVPEDADDATIRRAYIQLARQYHPDSGPNGGDPVMFNQVQKAYDLAMGKKVGV